jgi:hypothetical protein
VVNFLRGLIEFRIRPDDIFVVSYPRSGTTLMQMILHQLTSDGELSFSHISHVSPWFERSLALGHVDASDFDAYPSPRIFKSHLPYPWIPKGARYIYVVRDGMDVAVSYYHFYRSHLAFKGPFSEFFERFMKGRVQYRSWFKHVAGWRAHRQNPDVLMVEYERLVEEMEAALREISSFCKLPIDPRQVPRILERCSFDFMKRHEEKFDHITAVLLEREMMSSSFIRQGRVGVGREYLTVQQEEAFEQMAKRVPERSSVELYLADFLH